MNHEGIVITGEEVQEAAKKIISRGGEALAFLTEEVVKEVKPDISKESIPFFTDLSLIFVHMVLLQTGLLRIKTTYADETFEQLIENIAAHNMPNVIIVNGPIPDEILEEVLLIQKEAGE